MSPATTATIRQFPGLDLRSDPQETPGALDMLNVELDQLGRMRSRDGYLKVTTSAGATRYDSVFSIAGATPVSSSLKFAGTGADDAAVGTVAWTNPGNILATDAVYATATVAAGATSHYLKATNFGFAVPGTATITGVTVVITRHGAIGGSSVTDDSSVKIVKAGSVVGADRANLNSQWSNVDAAITYGSSSDLWGTTLTPADVNGATFGAAISVRPWGAATSATASVDSVKITVYYQPLANVAVAGAAASRLDVIDTSGAVAATLATATDTQQSYVAFGSPATSAVYIANSGATIRKLVGTTFSQPATMPKAKFVGLQSPDNRLVAANIAAIPSGAGSTASTSLVHFSDAGSPEVWGANSYVYLTPGDNEDIQGLVTWQDKTFVFKSSRFFNFWGNSTDNTGNPLFNKREVSGAGMVAPLGVAAAPNGVYFLDRRGIYFTTGGPPQRISDAVAPLFQGGANSAYLGGTINPSAIAQASMGWFNDRLYVGLPLGSATTNSHTLVFDPGRQQWMLWDIPMGDMASSVTSPGRLFFTYSQGTFNIGQYAENAYTDDAGTAIASRYRTGFQDFGTPTSEKAVRALFLDGTGTVTVKTAMNDALPLSTGQSAVMGTSPAVAQARAPVGIRGRNVSVDVSATSGAWSLSELTFDIAAVRAPGIRSS